MSPQLGNLYRKYLRGKDLKGEMHTIQIQDIFRVEVTPPPSYQPVEKWCLQVSGLPGDLPDRILFGPKGEESLLYIFGPIKVEALRGKSIIVAPKPIKIAGRDQIAVVFRKANGEPDPSPVEEEEDVVQFTDDDDIPF